MKKLILIILFVGFARVSFSQTTLDSAVSFTVKDVQGTTFHLFDILDQGKTVVLDFFTVTCGPCATYTPEISESYRHFGCNSGNVVFLGINWGADNSQVIDFGQTNGAAYPEISGTEGNGNHVVSDFNILSYPTVILIRPDRLIAEKFIWPPSTLHLDSVIVLHGGMQMDCTTSISEKPAENPGSLIQSVFPNPASVSCTVVFKENAGYEARLLDSNGREVRSQSAFQYSDTRALLDVSGLLPGFYLLQLLSANCIMDCKPLMIK
jgi:thiol-disulfide isomerase/thioredoxin